MKALPYNKKRKSYESNWVHKSLESLEKDNWGETPKDESYLITTCYNLRKKPINQLDIEDLRILIGQNIGLKFLIPLALKELKHNILAEGDFYEGDLLKAVLTSDVDYWKIELEDFNEVNKICSDNISILEHEAENYSTGKEILKALESFTVLHSTK